MFGDRKIFQTILSLGLENVVRILLGAVASVLIGRHLGAESYGKLSFILSVVLIFSPLINFSMNEVIVKELIDNKISGALLFRAGLFLRFILGSVGLILCLLYNRLTGDSGPMLNLIALYAGFFFFKSFDIIEYFFIAKERVKELSRVRTGLFIITNILKIILVFLKSGWQWFIFISCFELALVTFFYLIKARSESWFQFKGEFRLDLMGSLFIKSLPFFLITLMTTLFGRVDHIFIWEYLGDVNLGEYSVVVKWGEFLNFLPLLLTSAFLPRILEEKSHSLKPTALTNFFRLNFLMSLFIAAFFFILGPVFIKTLYGESYSLAYQLIRYYSLQICLSFFYVAMVRYLLVVERMRSAISLYGMALSLNFGFNLLLIPKLGVIGAIYASITSYCVSLLISLIHDKEVRRGAGLYLKSLF